MVSIPKPGRDSGRGGPGGAAGGAARAEQRAGRPPTTSPKGVAEAAVLMASACPACQAWKTTSTRAPAVKPVAQEKAPSASPCKAKGLAAGSQARSKAKISIPCASGRALHGGVRSGDDDVTHDDGVTHSGKRSE
jgi:hypothetical protein